MKLLLILTLDIIFILEGVTPQFARSKINGFQAIDQTDAYLRTPELAKKYGLDVIAYEVPTNDGYLLTVHRIPAYGKPVLALIHGYPSSSREWFLPVSGSTKDSLGFLAAERGYDVWIFNNRGNPYSNKHISLSTKSPEFWDFSIDEQALFDFPAVIDKILAESNQTQLTCLTVSIGGMIALRSLAHYPEYNSKINLFIGYATTGGYLGNMTSSLTRFAAGLAHPEDPLKTLLFRLTNGQVVPDYMRKILQRFHKRYCQQNLAYLCDLIIWEVSGFSPGKWIDDAVELTIAQFPASSSLRSIIQLAQGVNIHQMIEKSPSSFYDFGEEKNLDMYGSPQPPKYDMTKVSCPVALYSGISDGLVSSLDVQYLASFLPNLIQHQVISYEGTWGHGDFYIARMARQVLYEPTLDLIDRFNPNVKSNVV